MGTTCRSHLRRSRLSASRSDLSGASEGDLMSSIVHSSTFSGSVDMAYGCRWFVSWGSGVLVGLHLHCKVVSRVIFIHVELS